MVETLNTKYGTIVVEMEDEVLEVYDSPQKILTWASVDTKYRYEPEDWHDREPSLLKRQRPRSIHVTWMAFALCFLFSMFMTTYYGDSLFDVGNTLVSSYADMGWNSDRNIPLVMLGIYGTVMTALILFVRNSKQCR